MFLTPYTPEETWEEIHERKSCGEERVRTESAQRTERAEALVSRISKRKRRQV